MEHLKQTELTKAIRTILKDLETWLYTAKFVEPEEKDVERCVEPGLENKINPVLQDLGFLKFSL